MKALWPWGFDYTHHENGLISHSDAELFKTFLDPECDSEGHQVVSVPCLMIKLS